MLAADDIDDAPVTAACDLGDDRIAIEAEERHRGGQHAGPLVVGFVQQLPSGASDHRMRASLAEMGGPHHGGERRVDRPLRVGEEGGDASQGLVGLGVEDVQDGADQQRVAGFFPVVPLLQRAFWVDQDIGDVLDVADLPLAAADLEQRIVGGRLRVRRIEQQHAAVPGSKARRQRPVLPLDVVDDGRARPGQQ